ncbi:MAG: DUF5606 domain-containing protein [Flavobacteriaceae bacterium]|jgi:hypothetical protein|nr:DUF5606 domain-containing protein [Flavobacteriaceae bacterium]
MDLTKIITVTGKPGLFELVSQTKGGFVVKDMISLKKQPISSSGQVSLLQNISIFTDEAEVPLISVLMNIAKKHNYSTIDFAKNDFQNLRKIMEEVQPDYAKDRVYDSDLKKVFSWYNILINSKTITEESIKKLEEEEADSEISKSEDVPAS